MHRVVSVKDNLKSNKKINRETIKVLDFLLIILFPPLIFQNYYNIFFNRVNKKVSCYTSLATRNMRAFVQETKH